MDTLIGFFSIQLDIISSKNFIGYKFIIVACENRQIFFIHYSGYLTKPFDRI